MSEFQYDVTINVVTATSSGTESSSINQLNRKLTLEYFRSLNLSDETLGEDSLNQLITMKSTRKSLKYGVEGVPSGMS